MEESVRHNIWTWPCPQCGSTQKALVGVVMDAVHTRRNVVAEMEAHLRAQKPARARERSLQEPLQVAIARVQDV